MVDGADPRALERVGSILGEKWTLESLLGSGGMGAVYAARHRNGARAAVKILHPELARIAEVRERFLREGYAANRVEHRGAVQVLDDDVVKGGPDDGSAYLVMELLEGESLQDRVHRTPKLGERELLEVMDAVLDVLAAAHRHGVVHRDLKPENIFLAQDPEREGVRLKVLDFGLARISEARTVTSAGIAVGTPSFMSPEQAAGRSSEIDGRTDIFALGATVFRILTGRRIHDVENMVQLVGLMATVPAPRLQSVMPEVSDGFARIVDRALAFDRADRYPDADAMCADVRATLDGPGSTTLNVIPFSARNVRVGSVADIAAASSDQPTGKASTRPSPEEGDSEESDASADNTALPSARTIGKSTTLPWAIVLVLLAIGAWQFGPSLQGELVRRSSLEPVRSLWASPSASVSAAPALDPPAVTSDGPTGDALDAATIDMDDETATPIVPAEDASPEGDAGEATAVVVVDASVPHVAAVAAVAAARPHVVPPPHTTNRPPMKKPQVKKPPSPPPPRHR